MKRDVGCHVIVHIGNMKNAFIIVNSDKIADILKIYEMSL